jgi:hypothetical protein
VPHPGVALRSVTHAHETDSIADVGVLLRLSALATSVTLGKTQARVRQYSRGDKR